MVKVTGRLIELINAHNSLAAAFHDATSAFVTLNILMQMLVKKGVLSVEDINTAKEEVTKIVTEMSTRSKELAGQDNDGSAKSDLLPACGDSCCEAGECGACDANDPVVVRNGTT